MSTEPPDPTAPVEDGDWAPLVRFVDDSHSFTYGFECGMIWADMERGEHAMLRRVIRQDNMETIRRMCIALSWTAEFTPLGDGWYDLILTHRPSPRPPLPRLRVVGGAIG